MTDPSAQLTVPDEVLAKFPDIIELIQHSESMNGEERQYWVNILPIMTPEQLQNLRDILENERRQLEAIDKKYAKQLEASSNNTQVVASEESRKERRQELQQKEQKMEEKEEIATQELLDKIQSL